VQQHLEKNTLEYLLVQSANAVNVSVVDFVTSGSNHIARSAINILVILRIVLIERMF